MSWMKPLPGNGFDSSNSFQPAESRQATPSVFDPIQACRGPQVFVRAVAGQTPDTSGDGGVRPPGAGW
jgi:hypothetical protein